MHNEIIKKNNTELVIYESAEGNVKLNIKNIKSKNLPQ